MSVIPKRRLPWRWGIWRTESGSGATGQKLIRTAWLELESTEFDEAARGLKELTEEYNGYFETSSVANYKDGARWGDYTVRIPAEQFDAFLSHAGALCHLTWQEVSQEDISEAYYDTAGRLKTQQIKLERLQELLSKAEKMEDIITLESAISETEWQIENLSGTLRHYDGKVSYATVHISLREVYKLSSVEEVPDTFGRPEKLRRSSGGSGGSLCLQLDVVAAGSCGSCGGDPGGAKEHGTETDSLQEER